MKSQILTPWIGTGTIEDPFRPLLGDVITARWTDITAQPSENLTPAPNLYMVELDCTAEQLAILEADPRFQILWSE